MRTLDSRPNATDRDTPDRMDSRRVQKMLRRGSVFLVTFRDHDGTEQTRAFRIRKLEDVNGTPCLACDCRWLPLAAVSKIQPYRDTLLTGR